MSRYRSSASPTLRRCPSDTPHSISSRSAPPPASFCPSSQRSHASVRNSDALNSSATVNAGSTPASTGRSLRRSAANAWIVEMGAISRSSSAVRNRSRAAPTSWRRDSIRSRILTRSSAAAFSVNVIATTAARRARPEATRDSTRSTSNCVLPVPAPASTTKLRSRSVRMRRRAASSRSGAAIIRSPTSRSGRRSRDPSAFARPAARARGRTPVGRNSTCSGPRSSRGAAETRPPRSHLRSS